MKKIIKTIEPISLTNYRSSIPSEKLEGENIYEDFREKTKQGCTENEPNNLRRQLLEEQGYICCYCMSRIDCKNSKIEHFKPQSKFRNLQIDYKNLFIACNGGEGSGNQFCDTKKGENELKHIDLLLDIQNNIKYIKKSQEIIIKSDDSNIDDELNEILNLNISILKRNRIEIYNNVINNLRSKGFDVKNIKKVLSYYKNKHNGKYEPFCEMIVYFLAKKLKEKGVSI